MYVRGVGMKTKLWNRLSLRLIVAISVILITILSIYTYISITNLDGYLTRNSFKNANNIITNQSKMRIFTAPDKKRVLGLINPINNEEDCYSADCHAHSPKIQILGVLDVMVSLAPLDSIKTETAKTTIINSAVITIVTAIACGAFIILLVNRPMRRD
jgi:hypothetical protein